MRQRRKLLWQRRRLEREQQAQQLLVRLAQQRVQRRQVQQVQRRQVQQWHRRSLELQ
jgi:hypothetical protein